MLDETVVALDVADTIVEWHPGAKVLSARGPQDALRLIEDQLRIVVAFVGRGPVTNHMSALVEAVVLRGGEFVLICADDEDGPSDCKPHAVLNGPFRTEDILAVLDNHGASPHVPRTPAKVDLFIEGSAPLSDANFALPAQPSIPMAPNCAPA
jgi:hypothetical protein